MMSIVVFFLLQSVRCPRMKIMTTQNQQNKKTAALPVPWMDVYYITRSPLASKARVVEDGPIIDTFPSQGNTYRIRQEIAEGIWDMESLFDYDRPVTTWFLTPKGEVLDIHLKPIGSVEFEIQSIHRHHVLFPHQL